MKIETKHILPLLIAAVCVSMFFACTGKKSFFTKVPETQSGIHFQNKINEADTFNILDYLYFYNGGGVAIGDVNNDGLQDIYFTSNQQSNKLYLNKGAFQFEDITEKAGVQGKGNWKTGVTMADVNADGLLDIYVCAVGGYKSLNGRNELFINRGNKNGIVFFTEEAEKYGLAVQGFNTQSTFFDYDKDGDLDMFLVNHSVHSTDTYVDASERIKHSEVSGDKLFRCDKTGDKIFFIEVTEQAGIYSSALGYGLNVIATDFNNDNWEDIYVSNDFHENDYYYINNRNGTFSELNKEAFGHESRFSMGSDVGDINNDGWQDLITLDMLPEDEKVLKSSVSDDPLDVYDFKMAKGYHHQYSKNCLQLNVGGGKKFSDIALFAGVAATDWSWAPLLADFNNDGIKDLFISNGVVKRPNDLDFLKFISNPSVSNALQKGKSADAVSISQMPEGKVSNYFFKGTSELKFINETVAYGFDEPSLSNGAAYADLDNDGDLDLIVNNINAPAGIYQNNANKLSDQHYLQVQLKGRNGNTAALGSKVLIKCKGQLQTNFITGSRGFQSASSTVAHFGIRENTVVDTLQIIWPLGGLQTLTNVKADQRLVIEEKNIANSIQAILPDSAKVQSLFFAHKDSLPINFRHEENAFVDFNTQPFIPHKISTEGPKLAVADVNGDGLEDFFVCGAKGQSSKLFIQKTGGGFIASNEDAFAINEHDDVNAIFFDADGDQNNDLYVVTGGNETTSGVKDKLYLNDGKGNFSKSQTFKAPDGNKSVVRAADVEGDGDLDLFVGGRVVAGNYGINPQSFLLLNDGKGNFGKASEAQAPDLKNLGMVTDAVWTDIDKDGWKDLVVVGEWMSVTVFKNRKGILKNSTLELGLETTKGLWQSVAAVDLNKDGYEELLVGNWGENSKLKASTEQPMNLYLGDLDRNGALDQILSINKNDNYYTFLGKEEIEKVLPGLIRKRYLDYKSMAGEPIEVVLKDQLPVMKKLSVDLLSSIIIQNKKGVLSVSALPAGTQWSPVFSFLADDINRDGNTDVIAIGNFHGVLPYEGRYDASTGSVLLNRTLGFASITPLQSGLMLYGELRDAKTIRLSDGSKLYVFAQNNGPLLFYKCK